MDFSNTKHPKLINLKEFITIRFQGMFQKIVYISADGIRET
jgi:hypothetical protein